ncbi:MAG TPA: hypothetical protein PLK12_07820 [Prolixibacteraceae bacterium]|nr:hypothetical protein [Prolixibacteraceae bacterium]
MKSKLKEFFAEGDFHLKEAKSLFFHHQEEQCNATCQSCKAVKKYLDAYEYHFNEHFKPTENMHLLMRTLIRQDPDFEKFYAPVFDVKCFAEEALHHKDEFFLYDSEVDKLMHSIMELRTYIAEKVGFKKEFLFGATKNKFMGT